MLRELLVCVLIVVVVIYAWRANKGTAGSHKGWIVSILGILLLMWILPMFLGFARGSKVPLEVAVETKTVVDKTICYEFYWKLPDGVYVNGRNEIAPDETIVEVVKLTESEFFLNQHYVEYRDPDTMRIRLRKTGDKSWEGTWEQDNPENHGRMELREVSTGIYSGDRTWKKGERGFCSIKLK